MKAQVRTLILHSFILTLSISLILILPANYFADNPIEFADVNRDGLVNILDFVIVGRNFGQKPPENPRADVNQDGQVDIFDLVFINNHFEKSEEIAKEIKNRPPNVGAIDVLSKGTILASEYQWARLSVSAEDPDGDQLTFRWEADVGELRRYELPKWQPEDGTPPEPTKEQIELTKPNHMIWLRPAAISFDGSFIDATVMVEVSDGVNPPVIRSRKVRVFKPTTHYECPGMKILVTHQKPMNQDEANSLQFLPIGGSSKRTEKFGDHEETIYSIGLSTMYFQVTCTQDFRLDEFRLTFDGKPQFDNEYDPNRCFPNNGRNMSIVRRTGQTADFSCGGGLYRGFTEIRIPVIHLIVSGYFVKITGFTPDFKYKYELLEPFTCEKELTIKWQ